MSGLSYAIRDTRTMLRRQLLHMLRYPMVLYMAGIPVVLLLLFVYVFGGTLGAGLGGVAAGRAHYLEYVLPGILVMTAAMGGQATAIGVAMDMAEGIVARFRTMAIARSSVLAGHVLGSMLQQALSVVIVVVVALLIGFRSPTGPLAWVGAAVLLAMVAFSVTWLSVACGLVTKSVESASNLPMPLMLLPFLGSGFVPTATLPAGLRWFAENQPFTPIMETLRALLTGAPAQQHWFAATAWCVAIWLAGYLSSRMLYERRRES